MDTTFIDTLRCVTAALVSSEINSKKSKKILLIASELPINWSKKNLGNLTYKKLEIMAEKYLYFRKRKTCF